MFDSAMLSRFVALACFKSLTLLMLMPDSVHASSAALSWRSESISTGSAPNESIPVERADLVIRSTDAARTKPLTLPLVRMKPPSGVGAGTSPVLFVPGGPGLSGIAHLQIPEFRQLFLELAKTREVILYDPRGTGASTPSLLPPPGALIRPETLASRASFLAHLQTLSSRTIDSLRSSGFSGADFGFAEAVGDIEQIRVAIGAGQLELVAHSFGAQVAIAYAQQRGHVSRMSLISPRLVEGGGKSPAEADLFLRRVLEMASQDAGIAAGLPNPYERLQSVLKKLDDKPLSIAVRVGQGEDTYQVGGYALRFMIAKLFLNDPENFIFLPRLIHDLETGARPTSIIFNLGRLARGGVSLTWFGNDASVAIPAGKADRNASEAAGAVLSDAMNFPFPDIARQWSPRPVEVPLDVAKLSRVGTLVVGGTLDGVTPVEQAASFAESLAQGSLLRVVNGGHQSLLRDTRVRSAIAGFHAGQPVPKELQLDTPKFVPLSTGAGPARR